VSSPHFLYFTNMKLPANGPQTYQPDCNFPDSHLPQIASQCLEMVLALTQTIVSTAKQR
jgi:hypothetical protein